MTDNPIDAVAERVLLPRALTAENGAKALLINEFHETVEVWNPDACGCGEPECQFCEDEPETVTKAVVVSWNTIKQIYARIVEHFSKQ